MNIYVALPEETGIPSETLTVLFGNLLENAVEAVEDETCKTEITVNSKIDNEFFYLDIKNTCTHKPIADSNGNYISTKRNDETHGIGLRSIYDTVKQYDGMIEIQYEDNLFSVRVMLPIKGCSQMT